MYYSRKDTEWMKTGNAGTRDNDGERERKKGIREAQGKARHTHSSTETSEGERREKTGNSVVRYGRYGRRHNAACGGIRGSA